MQAILAGEESHTKGFAHPLLPQDGGCLEFSSGVIAAVGSLRASRWGVFVVSVVRHTSSMQYEGALISLQFRLSNGGLNRIVARIFSGPILVVWCIRIFQISPIRQR